jgi:signal peptidase I
MALGKKLKITLLVLVGIFACYHVLRYAGILVAYTIPTTSNEPNIKCGTLFFASNLIEPKRGDFITFHYNDPEFGESTYVYRLCGIGNDTIQIEKGTLFINGKNFDQDYNLQHSYLLNEQQFTSLSNPAIEHIPINATPGDILYLTFVEDAEAQNFKFAKDRYRNLTTVPNSEIQEKYQQAWNKDYFGPLVIPEGKVFVLGDNRDNARDSRFIGLIDKTDITGVLWKKLFTKGCE